MFGSNKRAAEAAAAAAAAEAAANSGKGWNRPQIVVVKTWAKPRYDQGVTVVRTRAGSAKAGAASVRDRAIPRVSSTIEKTAPKLDTAVQSIVPVVDRSRDRIVDQLVPKVSDIIAAVAAGSTSAKEDALARANGAAAVLSGKAVAKPKRSKGRLYLVLGLLAGLAAAGAAVFGRKQSTDDDPWATPLSDPYASPTDDATLADTGLDTGLTSDLSTAGTAGAATMGDMDVVDVTPTTTFDDTQAQGQGDLSSLEGLVTVDENPDEVTVIDAGGAQVDSIPETDESGARHEGDNRSY